MNLPNYFLADLPAGAPLTEGLIRDACQALKRNREQYLARRTTPELIRILSSVAEEWLNPHYSLRRLAIEQGAAELRLSPATIEWGINSFFREVTEENLEALCIQDLGHARRLDGFQASAAEKNANRSAVCHGPELLAQVAAGIIPNGTLFLMIASLLLRSAQFVKCPSGAALLPRLFAHSIYEREPKLAACLELAEWKGGNDGLERALFQEADGVCATGSDETLAAIRRKAPTSARFVGYGHRVSFGCVARSALSSAGLGKLARAAAIDVAAWDQLGCLSPHVFYVETGGAIAPEDFAWRLAKELEALEITQPRGPVSPEVAAAISSRRGLYEVRAAAALGTQMWKSENSTAWTVVFESEPRFDYSCLHRFIYVKPVSSMDDALRGAAEIQGKISTVGLAAAEEDELDLARKLAAWGASRVCPIGKMQSPPLAWRHDGRPALADFVRWTDWER